MSLTDIFQIISTVAACIAATATAFAISSNTTTSRKRATIDLIMHQNQDVKLQEAISIVNRLARQKIPLVDHYKEDDAFRASILKVLNAREFTATGILSDVFDEEVYKQSQCTIFTRDWKRLECVAKHIRQHVGKETLYQDFEILAKKWEANPLTKRN